MSSNEEYLDNLLRTIMEEEPPARTLPDGAGQEPVLAQQDEEAAITDVEQAENDSDMLDALEAVREENEDSSPNDLQAILQVDEEQNSTMSAEDIETMFAALEAEDTEQDTNQGTAEDIILADGDASYEGGTQEDAIDFFAQDAFSADSTDAGGMDDDMLALLQSVSETEEQETATPEFDFFGMSDTATEDSSEVLADHAEAGDLDLEALLMNAELESAQQENPVEQNGTVQQPEEGVLNEAAVAKGKRAKREKKPKKEKPVKEKKQGFFSKLLEAFVGDEEDEAADSANIDRIDGYNMDAENQSILADLGEGEAKKKVKAEKKKKEKKEKEPKEKKAKKEKPPKKEKPAKEKKEKVPSPPEKKGRPIPPKRIVAIAALGATILIMNVLYSHIVPDMLDKKNAIQAYAQGNYEETFYLLQGKKLNAAEESTYNKALLVLQLERQLESYHNYSKLDMPLEALNALVKGVDKYQKSLEDAQEYAVLVQTEEVYQQLLAVLQSEYQLTVEDVNEILAQKDDVYYTIKLKEALGQPIPGMTADAESAEEASDSLQMVDILPEEEWIE